MIDQRQTNLLDLIPVPLKRVGTTGGGEYHGPCPFCPDGGKDRFVVQPNGQNGGRWWCRKCEKKGDAIAFVMLYENLSFLDACKRLNVEAPERSIAQRRAPAPPVHAGNLKEYPCFDLRWQHAARKLVYECSQKLQSHWQTTPAARYLEKRGITREAAQAAQLGILPEELKARWGDVDVWLPRGITIPWTIDEQLWNIRVRRPDADLSDGKPKYMSPSGIANGMYGISYVSPGDTVVMTEGEFDAILLSRFFYRLGMHRHVAVSIGSNTGARLILWTGALALAGRVLLVYDRDDAGDAAAVWWLAALGKLARRVRPYRKDITEMYEHGELVTFMKELA